MWPILTEKFINSESRCVGARGQTSFAKLPLFSLSMKTTSRVKSSRVSASVDNTRVQDAESPLSLVARH